MNVKMRESTCIVCSKTWTHVAKKGRQPKLCDSAECRSTHRKMTRKPKAKRGFAELQTSKDWSKTRT